MSLPQDKSVLGKSELNALQHIEKWEMAANESRGYSLYVPPDEMLEIIGQARDAIRYKIALMTKARDKIEQELFMLD